MNRRLVEFAGHEVEVEAMQQVSTCAGCVWWHSGTDSKVLSQKARYEGYGECRHHSPSATIPWIEIPVTQTYGSVAAPIIHGHLGCYPLTKDGCGDYAAKT